MSNYFERLFSIEDHRFLLRYEVFGEFDDELEGEPEYYIPQAVVKISELSETEYASLCKCSVDDKKINRDKIGKQVCELNGWLIMGSFMYLDGYDPHYLCDAYSADIEYCWSALSDHNMRELKREFIENVYYVNSINIEPDYKFNKDDENDIIHMILDRVLEHIDDAVDEFESVVFDDKLSELGGTCYIDTIAFYPEALPYDRTAKQELTNLACYLVDKSNEKELNKLASHVLGNDECYDVDIDEPDIQVSVSPEMYMMAMGMRVSGDTYPKEAKDREVWDLFEAADWRECGNSRLLYKTNR